MKWLRCLHQGVARFGLLRGEQVFLQTGDPWSASQDSGEQLAAAEVSWLPPCVPGQIIGLWNNFRAAAEKNGWATPDEPLFFLKSPGSAIGHQQTIAVPASYDGRVFYEGELAIVIGSRAIAVSPEAAGRHILGYTCANDVTAIELLNRDASFAQWARAKSFAGFGAFGPVIDTDFDPAHGGLRTLVNGRERQNYPFTDMFFGPAELVSRISHDLVLEPGDVILCGTSLGAMPMKPGTEVVITIDGLASLRNVYGG